MQEQIARARAMASASDIYEMSECPDTYATCGDKACAHSILMGAA